MHVADADSPVIAAPVTGVQVVCPAGHVEEVPVSEVFNVLLAEGLIAAIKPCARCGARADWRRWRKEIDVLRPKTNNV